MMSPQTLLNKERDFLELNRELEDKVKSLMVEVDSIISKQKDAMLNPKRSANFPSKRGGSRPCLRKFQRNNSIKSDDEDYHSSSDTANSPLNNLKSTEDENDCDDENFDDNSVRRKRSTEETIIRFLKAQVKKLQADVKAAQIEARKRDERCKELENDLKKQEERRDKLQNQISAHKETIIKAEVSNSELQSKVQAQNTEIVSLRKEIEGLKKDLKALNQVSSSNDLRLNRSSEENEKLRSALKMSQAGEKELREQMRKIQEEKRLALKNFEKQRSDIFQAFKKQSQLVDNLKKQKAYLEASKEIQFIEEDFTKLLDWKPDQ